MAAGAVTFPPIFLAADRKSLIAQRTFLRLRRVELALLVGAALCGLVTLAVRYLGVGFLPGSLVAGALFFAAGALETSVVTRRPERSWYQGRAVAESVKTLVWRYAVAGDPLGRDRPDPDATFLLRMRQIVGQFPNLGLSVDADAELTAWMRATRDLPLDGRRAVYREARIEEQRHWYARKANWNQRRVRIWAAITVLLQIAGVVAAFARGLKLESYDLLAVVAVVSTVAVAWLQIKQHATLAEAYAVAAEELSSILSVMPTVADEAVWARFVGQGEAAISREHTTWLARRS